MQVNGDHWEWRAIKQLNVPSQPLYTPSQSSSSQPNVRTYTTHSQCVHDRGYEQPFDEQGVRIIFSKNDGCADNDSKTSERRVSW
ncbi:hypothetical protein LSH36_342g07035 [Paralvinella palmiformis]|uniref:Uncharacterized protein n=1 Tax=Paralvinella palmiformis TaxID=53620 RepID=A0AAD9N0A3_9ANNE|nr:hypothetical protein LSH36_342g07035 [Paralvinella palmiformis]